MNLYEWLLFFVVIQIVHFFGTFKLYEKAGYKKIYSIIPIYSGIILLRIIQRPWWWIFLLFVPVANNIMFGILWVETAKTFGKTTNKDAWLSVLSLGFYNYYLSYFEYETLKYNPNRFEKGKPKDRGLFSSLIFAVVVASIIRTFWIEAYVIPTSSMEKTMLIGDFLFVNKMSYGTRVPMTQFTVPLVHDSIPIVRKKSYLSYPLIPYFRFFGLEKIDVNDIIVFNWPADMPKIKPIDKKTNYVKRCVGVAGDTLEIKNGILFLNGKKHELPDRARPQFGYHIISRDYKLNEKKLAGQGIRLHRDNFGKSIFQKVGNSYIYPRVSLKVEDSLWLVNNYKNLEIISSISDEPDSYIWPKSKIGQWNGDNYGPIYIPKKGATIILNEENIDIYRDIISIYEGNKLEEKDSVLSINGKETDRYTFKQNYYWAMGDNRHNSLDSRYWGFVPMDHIVGKPIFIWMSIDKDNPDLLRKLRWERIFSFIHGEGEPKSYFIPAIVLFIIIYTYNKQRKKRRKKKKDE